MAKTTKINNRRYLGNKYRLLPFIQKVVEDECEDVNTIVDILQEQEWLHLHFKRNS